MKFNWQRYLIIILLTLVAALLWAGMGAAKALLFYSLGLLLLLVHHLRNFSALDSWLKNPAEQVVPDGAGVWEEVFAKLSRLMRSQNQSAEQLSFALSRLQQATAAMPEGVMILNEADRIEWCNPVAEQHFGIAFEMDAGQQLTYLVRQPQFVEYLTTQNYSEPLVFRQPRQQEFILSLQLVPYGDKQKLLISRDVTRLEQVEVMRRDFVANVSHELRTPLTVVGGFLENLADENLADEKMRQRALTLMADQTRRMQRLVEDLLTLSRLENAQNLLREENVDVPALLHDLQHEAVSLSAGHHHIHLQIDATAHLLASGEELRSAFSNLISNAIRYTPRGGDITLIWQLQGGGGEGAEEAVFAVQDSGIGIDSVHIPRLTERFYRVDRSRSRATGGTGLGLAIVKHVLGRHQARLEITSIPDKGSRFSARFPAKRVVGGVNLV